MPQSPRLAELVGGVMSCPRHSRRYFGEPGIAAASGLGPKMNESPP
jgi:hypothetical protein